LTENCGTHHGMTPFMTSATNLSSSLLAQDVQVRFSFIVSLKQNFEISSRKNKVLVGTLKVYMKRREIQKMITRLTANTSARTQQRFLPPGKKVRPKKNLKNDKIDTRALFCHRG